MTKFDASELKLFTHIINFKQSDLLNFLTKYLQKHYKNVKTTKKYIVALGEIPVALVAHLDTVHPDKPTKKELYYDSAQGVIWSPEGLGADDRAGVYAIIDIIKSGYRPTIIFTTDEETGALGARQLVKDYPKGIGNLKYIIELDRRGSIDCVFYDCNNKDFNQYVESFGFVSAWGSFSDISEICPAWKIAGVNLSIGYQNEHSKAEYLKISWMKSTINKVIKMIKDIDNAKKYEYVYSTRFSWYDYEDLMNGYGYSRSSLTFRCHKCKKTFDQSDVVKVKSKNGSTIYSCIDCLDGGIGWCDVCEEIYELDENHKPGDNICPSCKKRIEKERGKKNNAKAI